jgi:hypothetical protein
MGGANRVELKKEVAKPFARNNAALLLCVFPASKFPSGSGITAASSTLYFCGHLRSRAAFSSAVAEGTRALGF